MDISALLAKRSIEETIVHEELHSSQQMKTQNLIGSSSPKERGLVKHVGNVNYSIYGILNREIAGETIKQVILYMCVRNKLIGPL